jgi:hypothetical protein
LRGGSTPLVSLCIRLKPSTRQALGQRPTVKAREILEEYERSQARRRRK